MKATSVSSVWLKHKSDTKANGRSPRRCYVAPLRVATTKKATSAASSVNFERKLSSFNFPQQSEVAAVDICNNVHRLSTRLVVVAVVATVAAMVVAVIRCNKYGISLQRGQRQRHTSQTRHKLGAYDVTRRPLPRKFRRNEIGRF